jgi:hypothetical protein
MVAGLALATPAACADVELTITPLADGFAFELEGAAEGGFWLVQHSRDGGEWRDLLFLDPKGGVGAKPGVEIALEALPDPDASGGLFRALKIERDDPFRRQVLAERLKWRLAGIDSYDFELRQNFGFISWHGTATVIDRAVASFETIQANPPFIEPPNVPTIDELFDRISNAIANDAETIDVTWHPTYGFPLTCYIDLSLLIADEEQSWTVEAFSAR